MAEDRIERKVTVILATAVEAVLCAVEFQRTIKERNATVEDKSQQMEFRVGINMGDIVIEESNLYGDGVNVAATGLPSWLG